MKAFHLKVDNKIISFPINEELMAYYDSQFCASNTDKAQRRKRTLETLLKCAYKKGIEDGKK